MNDGKAKIAIAPHPNMNSRKGNDQNTAAMALRDAPRSMSLAMIISKNNGQAALVQTPIPKT